MATTQEQERGSHTSASSAQADSLCPGRHLSHRSMPDATSPQAETGNRIHAALAKQDPAGLNVDEVELCERCQVIEKELLIRYFGSEVANMKVSPIREKRFWIEWLTHKLRHSGQPDAVYRKGTKALVIDYKTGRDEVSESPRNMQMRDLAVLTWVNLPLLNEVAVAVVQPWVTDKPELCIYSAADIKIATEEMLKRIIASNNPASTRTAGELQCKYCRFKTKCSEYQKWAGSMVPTVANILDVPVAGWSPDQCALFLNNMSRAEKWLEECKDAMKERIKRNADAIPGWTLKPGIVRETIKDAQEVFDRFSKAGGSLAQFMGCILVGKTKLKTQLAAVTSSKGKKLQEHLDSLLDGCVEAKECEPQLKKVEAE